MAIPGPGTAISINTIVGEFGGTTPHSISEYYRGGGLVPNTPGNSAIPTSGAIALGNFYGSANRNTYTLTISADTQNYDVYTNRGPAYIAGSTDITVQINPGVTVGSSSIPAYAMLVPSAFNPADTITIVNNGSIRGAGGSGGSGGAYSSGSPGSSGGNGLYVNRPTTVTNNGTVAGGGGGGGGGGGALYYRPTPKGPIPDCYTSGGGGGGGAGNNVGGGGGGGGGPQPASPGSSGTATTGGAGGGGSPGCGAYPPGSSGGSGGNAGAAGSSSSGSGGAAGNYITGSPFVTWPATGTRQGGVA